MTINLYNTETRTLAPFSPVTEGKAGIYVCGATVQGAPHIGHMRSAVVFDQLRRWLTYRGFEVTLVRNVTDIDDKILTKSVEEGREWWAHAYHYEQQFTAAYDAMDVLRPTYEPRATGHVTEMVELIGRLIDAGHAYPATDGSGDVYFDSASWEEYGALTHQRLEDMHDAADAPLRGKKDPRDFALWKGHKDGDPESASWPTPWGRGRPGWHLECSAMSTRYLGPEFDIHGGGLDLRFPHHENERAQSTAAGDGFARVWMHSGLLNIGGDKMSKSLGNSVFAHELFATFDAIVVRFFLSTAHYRSTLDFSEDGVTRQGAAHERFVNFLSRARETLRDDAPPVVTAHTGYRNRVAEVPADFAAAMDDDLSIPIALSVAFATLTEGFKLLDSGAGTPDATGRDRLIEVVAQIELMLDVLGVNPSAAPNTGDTGQDAGARAALEVLVNDLATERLAAKKEKDYARADAIRDRLKDAGVVLEDTPDGFRFHLA
ncbi:cysteine--tRNA ligase [Brevibacterium litoralis]|uniref:cysteine--tRNA ligase n=1 Tax=Brevibacterium litoralis TaxID=3138935 RepID=UPI0032EF942B